MKSQCSLMSSSAGEEQSVIGGPAAERAKGTVLSAGMQHSRWGWAGRAASAVQSLVEFSPHHSASAAELDAEHTQKVLEMEHTQQLKLKERQKFFEEAFQQDMEQYLSTGYLQIADRRGELGGSCRVGQGYILGA